MYTAQAAVLQEQDVKIIELRTKVFNFVSIYSRLISVMMVVGIPCAVALEPYFPILTNFLGAAVKFAITESYFLTVFVMMTSAFARSNSEVNLSPFPVFTILFLSFYLIIENKLLMVSLYQIFDDESFSKQIGRLLIVSGVYCRLIYVNVDRVPAPKFLRNINKLLEFLGDFVCHFTEATNIIRSSKYSRKLNLANEIKLIAHQLLNKEVIEDILNEIERAQAIETVFSPSELQQLKNETGVYFNWYVGISTLKENQLETRVIIKKILDRANCMYLIQNEFILLDEPAFEELTDMFLEIRHWFKIYPNEDEAR